MRWFETLPPRRPVAPSPQFLQKVMVQIAAQQARRRWWERWGLDEWRLLTPALAVCLLLSLAYNVWISVLPDGLDGSVTRSSTGTAARAAQEEARGAQLVEQGQYAEAREAYQKALGRVLERGDRHEEARIRAKLGGVYLNLTEYAQAEEQLHHALATYREQGNQAGAADVLEQLGDVYHTQGAPARARDVYQQALALFQAQGRHPEVQRLHGKLGPVYKALGDPTRALLAYESQLNTVGRTAADLLREMLPLYYDTRHDYRQVVDVASAVRVLDPAAAALAYRYRGLASKELGHLEQARQDLQQAAQRGDSVARDALWALEDFCRTQRFLPGCGGPEPRRALEPPQ